jgi:hypothetical protein
MSEKLRKDFPAGKELRSYVPPAIPNLAGEYASPSTSHMRWYTLEAMKTPTRPTGGRLYSPASPNPPITIVEEAHCGVEESKRVLVSFVRIFRETM